MFSRGSRYEHAPTYAVTAADGRVIVAVRIPRSQRPPLQGFHARLEGQRLDLIAAHHLHDATAFHRLCDANNAIVPDALASRPLVAVPVEGG